MIRRFLSILRTNTWDLDMAGYAALLLALLTLSSVLGPTLDRNDEPKPSASYAAAKD